MKKSKGAKASEGKDGVDMMSKLPDDILLLILSCLQGTEEVVRTSILSRRWRYLWTSIPSIDIDCTRRGLDPLKEFDSNGFKEFVSWVLLNKHMDLDSFRLWCAHYCNISTIRRWIHAAVMRKVKLLDLMFCTTNLFDIIELPHCLVTCSSLEVLKLCFLGWYLKSPKITGFPALRVLELNDVDGNDNLVKKILESCPLLEDLSLIDCIVSALVISSPKLKNLRILTRQLVSDEEFLNDDLDVEWRICDSLEICCPKLEFLRLTGYVAMNFLFQNLYSLKEAVIHTVDFPINEALALDLFARISHVKSLSITLHCITECFKVDPRVDVDPPMSLPNLKTLEIILDVFIMDALIPFLICFPHLESLHLIIPKDIRRADQWSLNEAATMSILTRHLKKVEFLDFDGEKPKFVLARLLLEHGNVLEEMVFSWVDEAKFHKRSMKTMKKVSNFNKASSTVKLIAVFDPTQANSRDRPQTKMIRGKWSRGAHVLK